MPSSWPVLPVPLTYWSPGHEVSVTAPGPPGLAEWGVGLGSSGGGYPRAHRGMCLQRGATENTFLDLLVRKWAGSGHTPVPLPSFDRLIQEQSHSSCPCQEGTSWPVKAACVLQGTEQGSKSGRASGHTASPIHWAAGGGLQRVPVLLGSEPAWGPGSQSSSGCHLPDEGKCRVWASCHIE